MMQLIRALPPSVIITDTKDSLEFGQLFEVITMPSRAEHEKQIRREQKGVNLSNKLTPNYLTEERERERASEGKAP